jgi:anti-anti-sigma regulatory factor/HAMP domain-containing protein
MVLLPAIAISATSAVLGWQAGRRQAIEQLEVTAAFKETEVTVWASSLQTDLDDVLAEEGTTLYLRTILGASDPTLYEDMGDELRTRFQSRIDQTGLFEELLLLDPQEQVILSTDATHEGVAHSDRLHFREGMAGTYVQPPHYSLTLGQTVVFAIHPLVVEQQVLGILVGRASTTRLNEIVGGETGLGKTGKAYLVDSNHTLLTGSHPGAEEGVTVSTQGADAAIKAHINGSGMYEDYRGEPVVGVYRWLPTLEVALLAERDESDILSATSRIVNINIAVALVSVVIAVAISLFVSRSIATPLGKLAETAMEIAAGDLERVAKVEREDEVGALARAFNHMTTQLRQMLRSEEERMVEHERLQQEVIEAQKRAIQELSTPIIPVMDRIIVMPLIGGIDTMRARDVTRSLLAGIQEHRAKVVILDITGVPVVDSGVASYLNRTIQAARLKGARAIVTGISDAVAETIVDLGIDWGGIETLSDLQTGLITALNSLGIKLAR